MRRRSMRICKESFGHEALSEDDVMQEAGDGNPCEPLSSERSSRHDDSNWLPDGWTVELKTRKSGKSKGMGYKCYVSPQGRKCYSKKQVFDYLKKIGRKEAHENTAFQTKRQRTTTVEGSSSDTVVKDSVEIPWSLFVFVVEAVRCRKLWEENKKKKRLKKRLKEAEEMLHSLTPMFKDRYHMRADWSYDPETAGTLVSREDEDDSGSELVSVSTFLENEKNKTHKIKKRKCCRKQTPREARRTMDILNSRWSRLERKLYVGNLPLNMTELRFKKFFEAYGPVECVELPTDLETGHCKGLGYIRFAKLEHTKAAQSLNGKLEIAGRTIKVCSCYDHLMAELQKTREQKYSRF